MITINLGLIFCMPPPQEVRQTRLACLAFRPTDGNHPAVLARDHQPLPIEANQLGAAGNTPSWASGRDLEDGVSEERINVSTRA